MTDKIPCPSMVQDWGMGEEVPTVSTLGQRRDVKEKGGLEQKNSGVWLFGEVKGRRGDLGGASPGRRRAQRGLGRCPVQAGARLRGVGFMSRD